MAAGCAAEIARLDELRETYARLLRLCREREELLAAQTDHLLRGGLEPEAAPPLGFGEKLLRDALREHPQHYSSVFAREWKGDCFQENEAIFEMLVQIDEAIGTLTTVALAASDEGDPSGNHASTCGSSSIPASYAARDSHSRMVVASLRVPTPWCADATTSVGKSESTQHHKVHPNGDELRQSDFTLPVNSTVFRPFLGLDARQRLREGPLCETLANMRSGTKSIVPFFAPCGALGAVPSPYLESGDVLHVPFSRAEDIVLRKVISEKGAIDSGLPPLDSFRAASTLLPGRTVVDCLRYWESNQGIQALKAGSNELLSTPSRTAAEADLKAQACQVEDTMLAVSKLQAEISTNSGCARLETGSEAQTSTSVRSRGRPLKRGARKAELGLGGGGGARRVVRQGLGHNASAMLRTRVHPTNMLTEWERQGGSLGARLRGMYAQHFWRSLHTNFQPTSVSFKPTGHVSDLAFSPAGARCMRLAVGSTEKPHEVRRLAQKA